MHSTNNDYDDNGKEDAADEDDLVADEVKQQDPKVEIEVDGAWRAKHFVSSHQILVILFQQKRGLHGTGISLLSWSNVST